MKLRLIAFCQMAVLILLLCGAQAHAAVGPLNFTVNMSEAVNVNTTGGTPYIQLDIGGVTGATKRAAYTGGTGTSALTFSYTPVAGDVDLDGITLTSPIELNGGAITDLNGNPITNRTFTLPDTSGVKINYPSLGLDFTNGTSGRYTVNGTAYNSFSAFQAATSATFTRNSVATYFDASGNLQTVSANVPRFDHDLVTHTPKGILIEEARTNLITNAQAGGSVNGVLGSGGSLPNGWNYYNWNPGITISVAGSGTANGFNYIDFRIVSAGTLESDGQIVFVDSAFAPAAVQGDALVQSVYLSVVAGSTANMDIGLRFTELQSGSYLTKADSKKTISATMARYTYPFTISNASTNQVRPGLEFGIKGSGVADITIRIAAPQLEKAAVESSYIPTTNAVVTRSKDSLLIPTTGWINPNSGTLRTEALNGIYTTGLQSIASLEDATAPDASRLAIIRKNASQIEVGSRVASVFQYQENLNANGDNMQNKTTMAYASSNFRSAINGTLGTADISGSIPTPNRLHIGNYGSANWPLNGWVSKVYYYPSRVSDAQIQLLTQ